MGLVNVCFHLTELTRSCHVISFENRFCLASFFTYFTVYDSDLIDLCDVDKGGLRVECVYDC